MAEHDRAWFEKMGIPYTREGFITWSVGYLPAPDSEEWTVENEAQLPKELQDWSQFPTELPSEPSSEADIPPRPDR